MNKKRITILTITFIVIGLMISLSATSTFRTIEEKQKPNIHWLKAKPFSMTTKASIIDQKAQYFKSSIETFAIPLFNGMHPTIATNGLGLLIGFDDLEMTGTWFSSSPDGGQSWSDGGGWEFGSSELPTIDHLIGNRFIGSMTPDYTTSGIIALCDFEDITDQGTWVATGWDWEPNDFYEFINVNFACHDGSMETWRVGYWTFSGYVGLDYNLNNAPLVQYPTDDNYATISGVEIEDCIKSASAMDKAESMHYAIWQRYNETSEDNDIIMRIDNADYNPETGSDGIYAEIITSENNENMDICAENDNIIIASENGPDIVCYYSTDGFNSFDVVSIGQGSNPRITETDDGAILTFIRNDVTYITSSSNNGVTWDNPIELSDTTVFDEYHQIDICEAGAVYAATDDIIYFEPDVGIARPIVTIGEISGGIGVNVEVENIGDADAVDVPYSITATGGILGMIDTSVDGIISIDAGSSTTVSLPMIIGIGAITIQVNVDPDSETAEGLQILFFTSI